MQHLIALFIIMSVLVSVIYGAPVLITHSMAPPATSIRAMTVEAFCTPSITIRSAAQGEEKTCLFGTILGCLDSL